MGCGAQLAWGKLSGEGLFGEGLFGGNFLGMPGAKVRVAFWLTHRHTDRQLRAQPAELKWSWFFWFTTYIKLLRPVVEFHGLWAHEPLSSITPFMSLYVPVNWQIFSSAALFVFFSPMASHPKRYS